MSKTLVKTALLTELFVNGTFIILCILSDSGGSLIGDEITALLPLYARIVPFVVLFTMVADFIERDSDFSHYFRRSLISIVVFIPMLLTWGDIQFSLWLSSTHLFTQILAVYDDGKQRAHHKPFQLSDMIRALKIGPAQLVLISFSIVILIGTILLMTPIAMKPGKAMSFVDALFMSTSATCVTGLTTKSLASDLSTFGQIVIITLIQIGGLSIMTLYSSMTIIIGKSMGIKDRIIMQDLLHVSSLEELFDMIVSIVKYTFFIELWGAIILTIAFTYEGFELGSAIYNGFFHSISAFCNAGFSLFSSNLEAYATNPLICLTITTLVTLGGIGFIAMVELREVIINRKSLVRMGLHTKISLIATIVLTAGGALAIFFLEFLNALDSYTLWEKGLISLFHSVTLRTAGFNTISMGNFHSFTLYMMTLFMFVGGCPGSTAGGIKTTTLAVLLESIIATIKGKGKVSMLNKTVSTSTVVKAIAITFISLLTTSFFIFLLMHLEPKQNFLSIFFEVISASGTVGLTLGITPYLSIMGKLAISALMLIGRIGPLTLILAIGQKRGEGGKFDYPVGRIMVG